MMKKAMTKPMIMTKIDLQIVKRRRNGGVGYKEPVTTFCDILIKRILAEMGVHVALSYIL